jgi:enoyl-CoA hydratase
MAVLSGSDFTTLRLERRGPVLRVTIDHPESEINAVDERLHRDLAALFAGLRREDEARAVVLTGRGRAFSAGATSAGSRAAGPGTHRNRCDATRRASSGICSTWRSPWSPR